MVIALTEARTRDKQQIGEDLRASLAFHPNILFEEDLQSEQQQQSLDSLADLVYDHGALPEEIAIEVITRIAHLLSIFHSFRLPIRMALDANNIYLDDAGKVKLYVPNEVFEMGTCFSFDDFFSDTVMPGSRMRESEQQAIEQDIRSLGALFCFALFAEDATPIQKLELRQLDESWEDEQLSLSPTDNLIALKSLILRMIRAGFAGGYLDMQAVVIDFWELGIVSFSHE